MNRLPEIYFQSRQTAIPSDWLNAVHSTVNELVDAYVNNPIYASTIISGEAESGQQNRGHVIVYKAGEPPVSIEEGINALRVKTYDQVSVYAVAESGYEFNKWEDEYTMNPRNILITPEMMESTGIVFKASFASGTVQVSFTSESQAKGSVTAKVNDAPATSPATVDNKGNITLIAVPVSGYRFKEWKKDGNSIEGGSEITVNVGTADSSYVAYFEVTPAGPVTMDFNGTELTMKCDAVSIEYSTNGGTSYTPYTKAIPLTINTTTIQARGIALDGSKGNIPLVTVTYDADAEENPISVTAPQAFSVNGVEHNANEKVTVTSNVTIICEGVESTIQIIE